MRLRDLGEFAVIGRVERAARRLPGSRQVVLGIGDDAAVLRPRSGEDVVVSTDACVEEPLCDAGHNRRHDIEIKERVERPADNRSAGDQDK